ncbi:MAG TPA: ABC transporter permease [Acidobacteriaceae bacterium]|nr:ABC transporter permease [Acidobacteriaceae bacterium]
MRGLRRLFVRLHNFATGRRGDARLREEMEHHLALQAEENVRAGLSPAEARRQAALKFGGHGTIREQYRAEEGLPFLQVLLQDALYAVRRLSKAPGFAAVVVLTLALGIGANAAIFSVVQAILLRPLAYDQPNRLVNIGEDNARAGVLGAGMSWPSFLALEQKHDIFSSVCGLAFHALTLTGHGDPADVSTIAVTPGFFSVLSTKPLVGRALADDDGREGAAPVAVLSEALWRSRFGGDPRVPGTAIELDQRAYTVVGVMPASFRTPFSSQTEQVWIPLLQDPLFSKWTTRPPQIHWMPIIARLQPGVSLDRAQAALAAFSAGNAGQDPVERGWTARAQPLQQVLVGDLKAPLLLLLGAVGLVLAIACANIANLLLAQATARSKEIAVRIALGASRGRIARQLLTENALLGLLGGAAGALLAWRAVPALALLLPEGLQRLHSIRVNTPVLLFALGLSIASSLAFGLAPVLFAGRSDPQTTLREGGGAGESKRARRARSLLAAGEIALATIVLAGAGLLLRSFARLLSVGPGFATDHVVKAEISLPRFQYTKAEQWTAFANQLLMQLQARPGMRDSAVAAPLPILDDAVTLPFSIVGNPPPARGAAPTADYVAATPQYFGVMGIALVRGRLFSADDAASMPPVAVISEALAKRYFPHQDPLGRHMMFGFPPHGDVSREIVGVVADVHDVSLAEAPGPLLYVPFAQAPFWGGEVVVRGSLSTAAVADAIRAETHRIDRNLPVTQIESFPEAIHSSLAWPRFRTLLVGGFGGMALLLAAIGVYGVVSFSVSRRTREIGIRVAMGASPATVRRLVLRESGMLAVLGLAVGIPAALGLTRLFAAMLFGIAPDDPLTFAAVALLLAGVTLAAAYLPARHAARTDPTEALRSQ